MTASLRGRRITGADREKIGDKIVKAYSAKKNQQSIRAIADDIGRSYGFVHKVLQERGVTLRGRGGPVRKKS